MFEFNSMRLRLGINFIFFDFPSNEEDDEYTKSARNEHTELYTDTPFFNDLKNPHTECRRHFRASQHNAEDNLFQLHGKICCRIKIPLLTTIDIFATRLRSLGITSRRNFPIFCFSRNCSCSRHSRMMEIIPSKHFHNGRLNTFLFTCYSFAEFDSPTIASFD